MNELWNLIKKCEIREIFFKPTSNGVIRFFRYAFVGGIASVVDWGILYFFTERGLYYMLSTVLGFLSGLSVNFFLSKQFVFKGSIARVNPMAEFVGYALIGLVGLIITLILMFVFTDICGMFFMLSKIITTLIVLGWNYFARKLSLYK